MRLEFIRNQTNTENRALLTWEAEGSIEPGAAFSRWVHWPGGSSGVTIGRGYDLSKRTSLEVIKDLRAAGLSSINAEMISEGAGLSGKNAARFVNENRSSLPQLTEQQESTLFYDILLPRYEADIRRILKKKDLVAQYGEVNWESLPKGVKELVLDMHYRGDFTPSNRKWLIPLLVSKDYASLVKKFSDEQWWIDRGVPKGRAEMRGKFARAIKGN